MVRYFIIIYLRIFGSETVSDYLSLLHSRVSPGPTSDAPLASLVSLLIRHWFETNYDYYYISLLMRLIDIAPMYMSIYMFQTVCQLSNGRNIGNVDG